MIFPFHYLDKLNLIFAMPAEAQPAHEVVCEDGCATTQYWTLDKNKYIRE